MEYKTILGIIATALSLWAYVPYFRDMLKGTTKPHLFTWIIWFLTQAIAFFAQVSKDAGPGAWATGISASLCLIVAVLSFKKGEKEITKSDWTSLIIALLAIALWMITSNPLSAVILVAIADTVGFIPTIRKIWNKPSTETASIYVTYTFVWIISIFALDSVNATTVLYPIFLVIDNAATASLILWRRKVISH